MSTLFTVRTAADRLGVGYSTLKQWIYDGAVRTVRTRGGHHRITELELQRLLLSGSGPSGATGAARAAKARSRPGKGAKPKPQRPSVSSASTTASSPSLATTPMSQTASTVAAGADVLISGRNQRRGVVEEVRGDGLLAQVRLRIGDQRLTAIITQDAVAELRLKRGDEALAIIKSTEVMIARERRR